MLFTAIESGAQQGFARSVLKDLFDTGRLN